MSASVPANNAQALIETYIRAKDENRPHLMARAFAPDARLRMTVKTEAIAFPAASEGLDQIAEVLVRRFGQRYDNVYTFCLGEPPAADAGTHACTWLVGMTDKESGGVRVGCGYYDWRLGTASPRRVQALDIVIEAMEVLPAADAAAVIDGWLARLRYPWCDAAQAGARAPALEGLAPVLRFLAAAGA